MERSSANDVCFPISDKTEWRTPIREQATLFFSRFDWARAFLVVVGHVVNAATHRITAHLTSVEGLQKFGDLCDVLHPRIKPEVVQNVSIRRTRR